MKVLNGSEFERDVLSNFFHDLSGRRTFGQAVELLICW